MRKLILLLTAFSLCFAVKAQFSIAMVGGPQTNAVSPAFTLLPDTVSRTASRLAGINFGFISNIALNAKQSFFFRTGVLYSAKGSQTVQRFDTTNTNLTIGKHLLTANTKLKANYIDVPTDLLFKMPLKGRTKLLLGAGLQTSLFYSGSTDSYTISAYKVHPDSVTKTEFRQTINNDLPVGKTINKYSVLHFSGNALTGLEFGRVFITVNYSKGLSDFYKTDTQSFRHTTLTFNLGIYLGNTHVTKANPIRDRDNDGVADDLDACPDIVGTPLTNGCPDMDGDGIADKDDKCPELPGTLKYKGCPVPDKDQDGVIDEEDECPDVAGSVQNKGCPLSDKDGDGVLDAVDKCPDVAGLAKYNGCPIPDTDKDGVNDEEDKCPDVAGSKKYGGCPVPDTDGDGVNDEEDKCPTQAGTKDNFGCPVITKEEQQKISYAAKQIRFEYNQATLDPSSYDQLDEVVNILKGNAALNLRVEGHTSGTDNQTNWTLSQKRADSVKDYFIKKGIAAERITAQGFGSSRPLNKTNNQKENPEDRRVELIIF